MPSEVEAIECRIERFIAILGALMALVAGLSSGLHSATGVALGTLLCWLNFRWLRYGATAVIRLGMAQAGAELVEVPRSMHAKFFGRLVLLLLAVYVILAWLRLPAVAVLCGLAAIVPAIVLELVCELMGGHHRYKQP
jgi:ATP synthase I subunit